MVMVMVVVVVFVCFRSGCVRAGCQIDLYEWKRRGVVNSGRWRRQDF
jgi:hypothetical protein